jgi:hypothetical protein
MPNSPNDKASSPSTPAATGSVHVKVTQAADVRLEDIHRLIGDPRKGVGVAATETSSATGIFKPFGS